MVARKIRVQNRFRASLKSVALCGCHSERSRTTRERKRNKEGLGQANIYILHTNDINNNTNPNSMKKIAILLCIIAISLVAQANDNEFVAFSVKGKVEHKAADSKTWEIVTTKTAFYKGGTVKLEKGAELVLLHKDYKTIKLAEKGNHKIDKLILEVGKTPTDESTAYLQFIWKEFNKKHKNAESYHREYMQTKGGVDRSGCSRPLMLSPAYDEKLFSPDITLTWEKDSGVNTYTVVFYQDELEDLKLLELDVVGNSLTLSAQTFWFRPGKTFYWVAYPKGKSNCARFTFKIIREEEFNKLLVSAQTQFEKSEKTPLDAIKAGSMLEEAGLLQQAGQYYYKALELSEFANEYKVLYGGWLARAGRFEEAQQWWVS